MSSINIAFLISSLLVILLGGFISLFISYSVVKRDFIDPFDQLDIIIPSFAISLISYMILRFRFSSDYLFLFGPFILYFLLILLISKIKKILDYAVIFNSSNIFVFTILFVYNIYILFFSNYRPLYILTIIWALGILISFLFAKFQLTGLSFIFPLFILGILMLMYFNQFVFSPTGERVSIFLVFSCIIIETFLFFKLKKFTNFDFIKLKQYRNGKNN